MEGETPLVKERPYIDYRLMKAIEEGAPVKVSDARPTRTNSKSNSLPSLANDGHKWTKWTPSLENGSIWWELDMENFYKVDRVEFTIISANIDLTIETSINQTDWKEVASGKHKSNSLSEQKFKIDDDANVRFLRVNITYKNSDSPVIIGEIEVFGNTN